MWFVQTDTSGSLVLEPNVGPRTHRLNSWGISTHVSIISAFVNNREKIAFNNLASGLRKARAIAYFNDMFICMCVDLVTAALLVWHWTSIDPRKSFASTLNPHLHQHVVAGSSFLGSASRPNNITGGLIRHATSRKIVRCRLLRQKQRSSWKVMILQIERWEYISKSGEHQVKGKHKLKMQLYYAYTFVYVGDCNF